MQVIASNHGSPYTEDYNLLYDFIRPGAVSVYLREFTADALASVASVAASSNRSPALLTLSEIAHALYGRRAVDPGGPSEFEILEPLTRCDTKSYADGVKILN